MLRRVALVCCALVCCALLLASCASIGVPQPTPTVAPTLTPSETSASTVVAVQPSRTPLPSATNTAAPTSTASLAPSETATQTPPPTETDIPSSTPSETATATATLTASPTSTPSNTPTPTMTASDTQPPSNTPLPRFEPTNTPTSTSTPTETWTPSITPSLSPTPTDTVTPLPTLTFTPTQTFTPSQTYTPEPSSTLTATITLSATSTVTATTSPTITASHTSGPPSTTPVLSSATPTIDPFFTTEAPTWTPFPTGSATPTVTLDAGPTQDATPIIITLAPSAEPPSSLPTETTVPGDATSETFLPTPTPTTAYSQVPPITPLPTISLSQQLFIPNTLSVTIGSLPFEIGPGFTGALFTVPGASNQYEPFTLVNPRYPNQSVITDEVGRMYWVVNGERIGLPAPFTAFGSETLENNDQLVRAAAWSPDGERVAFIVDNPARADANDGVWWWDIDEGVAYQVMHNCRRHVKNCADFVNAEGDPYINPSDGTENPNTGWYAQSISWSPDGSQLLVRLRIRDDERLAFIVQPVTRDENWKKRRGSVCKYELSDWSADGQSVLVAGRDANDVPVLGRVDNPLVCGQFTSLEAQTVDSVRTTPIPAVSPGGLPEGVLEDSEYPAGQQLQVFSTTGGLNLRVLPSQTAGVHRYVLNGEYVRVIAGPYDAEGYRWWRVLSADGIDGWMAGSNAIGRLLNPVDG